MSIAQWTQLSQVSFWVALSGYAVAMLGYFYYLAFRNEGVWRIANVISWVALAANLVSVVARAFAAERVPWGNMYEFSTLLTLLVMVITKVVVEWKYRVKTVTGFALVFSVITMAVADSFYVNPAPLVPALDSPWLKIHVIAVIVASALLALGSGVLSPLYLWKARAERRDAAGQEGHEPPPDESAPTAPSTPAPVMGGSVDEMPPHFAAGADEPVPVGSSGAKRGVLPSSETLDRLAYRVIAAAFPIWTFAVIAGAIWAHEAWGRYWAWDPKEIGAFVTWAIFAGYLHARATVGWKGKRAAILAIVGFISLLFSYYVVNLLIVGLHSYAGV